MAKADVYAVTYRMSFFLISSTHKSNNATEMQGGVLEVKEKENILE